MTQYVKSTDKIVHTALLAQYTLACPSDSGPVFRVRPVVKADTRKGFNLIRNYCTKIQSIYTGELEYFGDCPLVDKISLYNMVMAKKPQSPSILIVLDPSSVCDDSYSELYPVLAWLPVDKKGCVHLVIKEWAQTHQYSIDLPDDHSVIDNVRYESRTWEGHIFWDAAEAVAEVLKYNQTIIDSIRKERKVVEDQESAELQHGAKNLARLDAFLSKRDLENKKKVEREQKRAAKEAKLNEQWNTLSRTEKATALKSVKPKKAKKK